MAGTLPAHAAPVNSPGTSTTDGWLRCKHYSAHPQLTTLGPDWFSKGKATTQDRRGLSKIYLFQWTSPLGQDRDLFRGTWRYEAWVPVRRLYDLRQGDPLGFADALNREKAEQMLRNARYTGVIYPTQFDGRRVVVLFVPIAVTRRGRRQ